MFELNPFFLSKKWWIMCATHYFLQIYPQTTYFSLITHHSSLDPRGGWQGSLHPRFAGSRPSNLSPPLWQTKLLHDFLWCDLNFNTVEKNTIQFRTWNIFNILITTWTQKKKDNTKATVRYTGSPGEYAKHGIPPPKKHRTDPDGIERMRSIWIDSRVDTRMQEKRSSACAS